MIASGGGVEGMGLGSSFLVVPIFFFFFFRGGGGGWGGLPPRF